MNELKRSGRAGTRRFVTCLVLGSAALAQIACSPDPGRNATPDRAAGAASADGKASSQAAASKPSIGEFQLGAGLGSHGGIAQGTEKTTFSSDETINVAMRVRSAPAGTQVKVVWKSPAGEALGEETKRLLPGQDYMYFSADGANLPPGAGYHAEISANGALVTTLRFDLAQGG